MNYQFQDNLSRPGIIDARARYRAAALQLRNAGLERDAEDVNELFIAFKWCVYKSFFLCLYSESVMFF